MQKVAVLIPCHNEEQTVAKVVGDYRAALPDAEIFVFDNRSTDATAEKARSAGAVVVSSPRLGKGNVVRHMFRVVEADAYLMVDGDDTYPAHFAPALLEALAHHDVGMVVGMRLQRHDQRAFPAFHRFGNKLVAGMISLLFGERVSDVMSGLRAISRDFAKTVPLQSSGFEIETEMTLQALAKRFPIVEVPIEYGVRPAGSHSKLSTFSDGYRVLKSIFIILKDYKPLFFFGLLAIVLACLSAVFGSLPVLDYIESRYVFHVPLAILAVGAGILAAISLAIGLILDTIAKYQAESFEMIRRLLGQKS